MAIAAGIIKRVAIATRVAFINVSTQRFRAARFYGAHHFQMRQRQIMGRALGLAIRAKDVAHFQSLRPLR